MQKVSKDTPKGEDSESLPPLDSPHSNGQKGRAPFGYPRKRSKGWRVETTGFYYLQSRYYDPIVKRFLNADAFASTGQGILGYNSFAYCLNNPIRMKDSAGQYPVYADDIMEGRVSARDGYDVYGYEFSDGCNMQEYDANSKSFYYKPNQYGRVFIAPYSDNPSIPSDFGGNDVLILDNRNYYVTQENMPKKKHYDPSFKILDSYKITNYLQQKAIIKVICDYNARNPSEPAWNHTVDTAIEEWKIHNYGFYWSRHLVSFLERWGE